MTINSEREKLTADFRKKQAKGLKDIKFFFGNVTGSTVEDVCAVVNRVLAKVANNESIVHKSWNDSQRPKA